jgi:anthranilate phosphoribosyltransferase
MVSAIKERIPSTAPLTARKMHAEMSYVNPARTSMVLRPVTRTVPPLVATASARALRISYPARMTVDTAGMGYAHRALHSRKASRPARRTAVYMGTFVSLMEIAI